MKDAKVNEIRGLISSKRTPMPDKLKAVLDATDALDLPYQETWTKPLEELFDAGYTAASRWRSIERDGLPTEDGWYVWKTSTSDWEREVGSEYYEAIRWSNKFDSDAHDWTRPFTHYQKIEFKEPME